VLGAVRHDGAIWVIAEVDRGVTLRRLLQVTTPSPAQAGVLAADLLEAVEALHAAGHAHGKLHAGNVHLSGSAGLRLADWADAALLPPSPQDELRRADVAAAAALVAQLGGAARRAGGRDDARRARLLAALEQAANCEELAEKGPGAVARVLEVALGGPGGRARAGEELASLVAAVPPTGRLWLPTAETLPGAQLQARRCRRLARVFSALWSRLWRMAATLAVLGAVVGMQLVLLGDRITPNLDVLLGRRSGERGVAGVSPAGHALHAVPVLAPLAAGPITGVDLRAPDACRNRDLCRVVVHVHLQPQEAPLRAAWTFEVVDRCTGARVSHPGGAVWVRAGTERVTRLSALRLPLDRPLAVIALMSEPASVAAGPLRLADGGC
jgi:hypothetical protein